MEWSIQFKLITFRKCEFLQESNSEQSEEVQSTTETATVASSDPEPQSSSFTAIDNPVPDPHDLLPFKLLAAKQKNFREKMKNQMSANAQEPEASQIKKKMEKELQQYWTTEAQDTESPLDFWIRQRNKIKSELSDSDSLKVLSKIALTLLTTPASSGASEREFSKAGWLCDSKRNRLTGENLAAEVLLTCNRHILRKYF